MAEDYQKGREDDEVGRCGSHSDTIDLNDGPYDVEVVFTVIQWALMMELSMLRWYSL